MKNYIILSTVLVLLSSCKSSSVTKKNISDEPLNIFITSDIHFLSPKLFDDGEAFIKIENSARGTHIKYTKEILETLKNQIKIDKPEVLILSGDLTVNGEKESHKDLAKILKEIEKDGTSVLVVPGNHDINNTNAREFKNDKQLRTPQTTKMDFKNIYSKFGYSEAVSQDDDSLSYLTNPIDGLYILMLDSAEYEFGAEIGGSFSEKSLDWIKNSIDLAKENNSIILTALHHNSLSHNDMFKSGFVIEDSEKFVELIENNSPLVFSGHIHTQDIVSNGNVTEIVSQALNTYPHQFGNLAVTKNKLEYSTKKLDIENYARSINSKNEDLLNFDNFSNDMFYNSNFERFRYRLYENGIEDDNELDNIANLIATLNSNYFSGKRNFKSFNLGESEEFKILSTKNLGGISDYITGIVLEEGNDETEITIELNK